MWVGGGFGGGAGAGLIGFGGIWDAGGMRVGCGKNDALLRLTHPTLEGVGDFGWGGGGWWNMANGWGFRNIRV